jgi:hypothetical protein
VQSTTLTIGSGTHKVLLNGYATFTCSAAGCPTPFATIAVNFLAGASAVGKESEMQFFAGEMGTIPNQVIVSEPAGTYTFKLIYNVTSGTGPFTLDSGSISAIDLGCTSGC